MDVFDMDKLQPGDIVMYDIYGNGQPIMELVVVERVPTRRDSVRHLLGARRVREVMFEEKFRLTYDKANLVKYVRTLTIEERLTHPLQSVRSISVLFS